MKKLVALIMAVIMISCQGILKEGAVVEPPVETINELSKLVIADKCLDSSLANKKDLFISDSLYRFHLVWNLDSIGPEDMLHQFLNGSEFLDTLVFDKADSSYLITQEKFAQTLPVPKINSCFKTNHLDTLDKQVQNDKGENSPELGGYLNFSIPIFSKDLQTALVFVKYQSFRSLVSHGQYYILSKRRGSWQIVRRQMVFE